MSCGKCASEVSCADDNGNLNSRAYAFFEYLSDRGDKIEIENSFVARERLSRKLEENSAIFRLLIHGTSPHFVDSYYYTINPNKCIQFFCEHSVFLRIFYEITAHSVTVKVISKA